MRFQKIIWSSIAATSLMTLFSYALSHYNKQDYREPELLADMEEDLLPALLQPYASSFGWLSHYMVGLGFTVAYLQIFGNSNSRKPLVNGLIFGGLAGASGVVGWKAVHTMHRNPPNIDHRNFYVQLVLAHLVFGVGAAAMLGTRNNDDITSLIKKVKAQRQFS